MGKIILLFWLGFFSSPLLMAQCNGGVNGIVIDKAGRPLEGALVSLEAKGVFVDHRMIVTFPTDSHGYFHADIDAAATYLIFAMKLSEGYPQTRLAFYSNGETQELVLDCERPRSGVIVQLGPRAGRIRRISVVDALTGKAVPDASITLRRVSDEDLWVNMGTTSKDIWVPSGVAVTYQITAPGYADSLETRIHLMASEEIDLEIKLNPVQP